MKKQKLLAVSGLLLAVAFLAGCGNNPVPTENMTPVKTNDQTSATTQSVSTPTVPTENSQAQLPSDVSTQPATTPADEAKNIDKDLKAMDANNQDSLSNKDLGL
jgi:uncharacterized lipoprotein YajG